MLGIFAYILFLGIFSGTAVGLFYVLRAAKLI
ncbi:MAG: cytochrome b6-f complex subunit PetL [Thermosynechococcaceae cyanobacterium]